MTFLYLGLILFGIGFVGLNITINYINHSVTPVMICCTLFCVGVITLICYTIDSNVNPTAMDVYREKTTLSITYEDGAPVDSTVVFKKK